MDDLSGKTLVQRFRLDALERQDHLGDEYRSWDLKRSLPLSIKVLRASLPYDPALLSFQQGAITLQSLSHPHIVPFYGLFQDGSLSFMVERYVEGYPLHEHLLERAGRPVEAGEALTYLKALSQALAYAHGFGLVHCSVNPNNIWLEYSGNIQLGGFGFARGIDSHTSASGIAGPPVYLAPEMLERRQVSPATDIYGLGLTLFELLTGQHPFLGPLRRTVDPAEAEKLGNAHLNQPPPSLRSLNPQVPTGLEQVALTALAKQPRERYQSPQEMLEIACALLELAPESVPDRFGEGRSISTLIGSRRELGLPPVISPAAPTPAQPPAAAPAPAYVQPGLPPGGPDAYPASQRAPGGYPATQVVPGGAAPPQPPQRAAAAYPATQAAPAGYAAAQAAPGGYPATQTMPGAGRPAGAPPSRTISAGGADAVRPGRPGRSRWLPALVIAAGLGCLLLSGAIIAAIAGGYITFGDLPTATPLPTNPAPAIQPTNPPPASATLPPRPSQGALSTNTPPPTAPPQPSPTRAPSDTPPPSPTRPPTRTPAPSSFTVTIRNNLNFPVYAFRDGVLMGSSAIPAHMYIYYRSIPPGRHSFTVCQTPSGQICQDTRQVDVQADLTISFP
ncbi:MAG: serine/threonine-protein kinase [Chloroflexota bacterium]